MPVLLSFGRHPGGDVVGAFAYVPSSARIAVLPPPRPDPASIEKAGDILASARRDLRGRPRRTRVRGRKGDRELGERVGAASHTLWGKGTLDDRWSVGIFGTFTTGAADR